MRSKRAAYADGSSYSEQKSRWLPKFICNFRKPTVSILAAADPFQLPQWQVSVINGVEPTCN